MVHDSGIIRARMDKQRGQGPTTKQREPLDRESHTRSRPECLKECIFRSIPSFFAQTINRDRVILFFCLNEDVSPCLCFQLSKPFVNNLEAIRIHAMPSKRINKIHPADAP